MKLFRERLLARLIERHAISEELARKLLAWRHPGFSAHVGEAIPFKDKEAIEDVVWYLVRSALSLKKLVYFDGQKAVLYRSRMNPSLGRNFEAMDPLEWLARLADHIPDPGKHRTHFYAHYANRVRGQRPPEEVASQGDDQEQPKKRRAGRGSSPRSFRRIRSSADAAVARPRSSPTSPTASPSARSWTISTSACRRSHLLLTCERSSVCRWTTKGERSQPANPACHADLHARPSPRKRGGVSVQGRPGRSDASSQDSPVDLGARQEDPPLSSELTHPSSLARGQTLAPHFPLHP